MTTPNGPEILEVRRGRLVGEGGKSREFRLNREFRRRTKTQGSFSTENAGVTLLCALVAFGQIEMRRIVGYQDFSLLVDKHHQAAA